MMFATQRYNIFYHICRIILTTHSTRLYVVDVISPLSAYLARYKAAYIVAKKVKVYFSVAFHKLLLS
ncbi:MAG TPA: hypothetical protein PKV06_07425 [bacterium]|nr:hypothetical protein [bacterium]